MTDTDLRWQHAQTEQGKADNAATVKRLEKMIRDGDKDGVLEILGAWADLDRLSCIVELKPSRAQTLLSWLPDDLGLRVLAELDPRVRGVLLHAMTERKFKKLVRRLDRHELLHLLSEFPPDVADAMADWRDKDAEEVRKALHDVDSAGAVMRQGALSIPLRWRIGDVIEDIRTRSAQIDQVIGLHVVDDAGRLAGYLRLRDLLLHPNHTPISDVVRDDPVVVTSDTDQEAVLELARRRKVNVIAVVDGNGVLLGAITPADLDHIMQDEAEEDMLLMGGVSPASTSFDTAVQIVQRRIPWLLVGLVGSSLAALVIGGYEEALAQAAILASFIPVIMATAGNAGIQASTVSIQGITSGIDWSGDFGMRIWREFVGATFNGLVVGATMALLVLAISLVAPIDRPGWLALTVCVALTGVTIFAGTFGCVIPYVLRALKQDPAVATGIFITTTNDVIGVLLYFGVAMAIYL